MMEANSADSTSASHPWLTPDVEVEWEELALKWDTHTDNFMQQVKAGKEGKNIGMPNGLTSINRYIHGTHRARYYLIGADSGVGKTTIADFMYIFSLWIACRERGVKLYIKYFSFEISAVQKKARWVCQWIKRVYNVDMSVDYVLGHIEGVRLTDDHFRMVQRGYMLVEEMMKDIHMIDHLLHPTGMLNVVLDHHEKIGTVHRDVPKEGKKKGMITHYTPKDPQDITIVITDHVALINQEAGASTTKDSIDRWSMYSVQLRNIFGDIIINIQQFSANMQSVTREKKTPAQLAPQRLDFGDSTYTYRDADLVYGLVKPINAGIDKFFGYDLKHIGSYMLALYLLKNRYGPADKILPIFTNPVAGMFWDLPGPQDIEAFVEQAAYLNSLPI